MTSIKFIVERVGDEEVGVIEINGGRTRVEDPEVVKAIIMAISDSIIDKKVELDAGDTPVISGRLMNTEVVKVVDYGLIEVVVRSEEG